MLAAATSTNFAGPGTQPNRPMSKWSLMAIAALVILAVSAGLALYYGIYADPIGTYASYVCYAMILFLIFLAIIGKKLEHRTVIVPKKRAELTQRVVSTEAGSIQMASD